MISQQLQCSFVKIYPADYKRVLDGLVKPESENGDHPTVDASEVSS